MKKNIFKPISLVISVSLLATMCPMQIFAAEQTQEQDTTIQIVHTNDIHGYYTETKNGTLGFAVLKSIVDQEGADLVLDMGDTFHGQAFATIDEGSSIAQLMKEVGYDAVTPGNHDWSYGAERLKELEKIGGFPILAANVTSLNGDDFFEQNYLVKEVTADDGTKLKVGVVGVIDDEFYRSTASDNIAGLTFEEEAQEATKIAQYLNDVEKCDIVLAMTHQSNCEEFIANIKGIDAVLAGHEHIVMDESYPDSEGKLVPVVEAGYYMNNIGVMELTLDAESKEIVSVDERFYTMENDIAENEQVKESISEIEKQQQVTLSQTIGYTENAYPYSWEDVRIAQQDIGKLVTESYMEFTGADVAFENAGGIRAGLDAGDITYQDVISISPYGNVVVTKKLTGKEIIDILNQSLAIGKACDDVYTIQKEAVAKGEDPYQYSWPEDSGSYLQFSGIDVETNENGQIISAKINGTDVNEKEMYVVAMNNYLGESDLYTALPAAGVEQEFGTCEQALIKYIRNRNNVNEAEGSAEASQEPLTRGEVVQLLMTAADAYQPNLQKTDIIKGYDDGTLHEDMKATKLEALIMLNRAFGTLPESSNSSHTLSVDDFTDIPVWAKSEMEDVLQSGIVEATANGLFHPNETIDAEQMEMYINQVLDLFEGNK
ncbi:bifunctional metallophosphatase/5'-nucleotidase [Anaerotignum lactatifermentans]|uniref:bifunctional metallophosphatase/5'-nucleotidase n=1 Tax=Anaerotignum lactatifermentans TaxID=160404 RepID=UPI002672DC88|nr:5'-nucleotidase C-terminal domain-containing protein [Anaerotignum lactatifermentans]